MNHGLPFSEVLEAADHLTEDEQLQLIAILNRRLSQANRQRIASEVLEAREEFAAGRCMPMSPGDLIREIQQ